MSVVSRPVCVGEIVIFVRYATAILNCPTLVFKSPIMCSLNPSPERSKQKINTMSFGWTRLDARRASPFGNHTYLNCVFEVGLYRCCRIFYTILCFVSVIICMRALNVSLVPMTSAMFPYDCKLNKICAMLYPKSVYCTTMTRLPISSYHHPQFAEKFPHIAADDSKSIHPVLCRSLS